MPRQALPTLLASTWILFSPVISRAEAEQAPPPPIQESSGSTQVALDSPADDSLQLFSGAVPTLDFKWSIEAAESAVFEIAADDTFSKKLKSIPVKGRKEVTRVRLPVGTFFWRLSDGEHPLSGVRKLELRKEGK